MEPRETWKAVRQGLLDLHKILLDRERALYEAQNDVTLSPGEFLQLALSNDQFTWLRQLSGLVIQFDEALSVRKPATLEDGAALLVETRKLLTGEGPAAFEQRYQPALSVTPAAARLRDEILLRV
jgi:hypothetical protein